MAEFEEGPSDLPGVTLFDAASSPFRKRTGVYWPKYDAGKSYTDLDVVIWLHGLFVTNAHTLLMSDPDDVRKTVNASGKDMVLIAPFVGSTSGYYGAAETLGKAGFGQLYLDQVLGALAAYHQRCSGNTTLSTFRIRNLVLAGHSAGGWSVRQLVASLGSYAARLSECWIFDGLYAGSDKPRSDDDASFWYDWATGAAAVPLHVFAGASTVHQSVKLALMAKGLATAPGQQASPRKGEVSGIHVALSGSTLASASTLGVFLNNLAGAAAVSTPKASPKQPANAEELKATYAYKVAADVAKAHPMSGSMDAHYGVAKTYFLLRLKSGWN